MYYDKVVQMMKDVVREKDSETIFSLANKLLSIAEQEGRIDDLLKQFPGLYEVVITFDRFYKNVGK